MSPPTSPEGHKGRGKGSPSGGAPSNVPKYHGPSPGGPPGDRGAPRNQVGKTNRGPGRP